MGGHRSQSPPLRPLPLTGGRGFRRGPVPATGPGTGPATGPGTGPTGLGTGPVTGPGTARGSKGAVEILDGVIASAGFASGHRFVFGWWIGTPLGTFCDLMWALPDGTRRLIAPSAPVAGYVSGLYSFDEIVVSDLAAHVEFWPQRGPSPLAGRSARTGWMDLHVAAVGLSITLTFGAGLRLAMHRPRWFTSWVEAPVARRLLGVRVTGVNGGGSRQWYQAQGLRLVSAGCAALGGHDLGSLVPLRPPVGFGFSEPLRRPAAVSVRTILLHPGQPRPDRTRIQDDL
ncbi:MAG: hypothetical protein ACT4OS_05025 [Acidimicrobiales bacterium]